MALEDAASLCALLPPGTTKGQIHERLQLYEKLRDERAHKIQHLTRLAGVDLTDANRKDFSSEYIIYPPRADIGRSQIRHSSGVHKLQLRARRVGQLVRGSQAALVVP